MILQLIASQFLAALQIPSSPSIDRGVWGALDKSTDFDLTWHETGVTREYWLTIENVTLAVDGYERPVLAFNGTIPGPTIEADWGDTIRVHLKNNLKHNGTGIHWHGQRQLHSNLQDGVGGITECPLAPGANKTYQFTTSQYGTGWYHSHLSVQLGEGAFGPTVIHGPASLNYDEDLGPFLVSDWYHNPAFSLWQRVEKMGSPPIADNGLINGMNTFDCGGGKDPRCRDTGRRYEKRVKKGKRYLVRLVNAAVDNHFKVSLDNHRFWVIANDFVPIVPFETDWVNIGIGQRYDIVFTADQEINNYWFRAVAQLRCSFQAKPNDIRAIFRYEGANETEDPTSLGYDYTDECVDFPISSLVPVVSKSVKKPRAFSTNSMLLTADRVNNTDGVIQWMVNKSSHRVDWWSPSVLQHQEGRIFQSSLNNYNISLGQWVYIIIETPLPYAHPVHLHGHDFFILAQGEGKFSGTIPEERYSNPPRRDVAHLPPGGHLVLAWETDNEGIWLLHCHIAWHASMGFSVQFLEGAEEVGNFDLGGEWNETCVAWRKYYSGPPMYLQEDSGVAMPEGLERMGPMVLT